VVAAWDPVDLYHCGTVLRARRAPSHRRRRALGERWIWATITEVRMNQPGTPGSTQVRSTRRAANHSRNLRIHAELSSVRVHLPVD